MTHNEITFEQALARLENIVKQLESGEIALEKSMELFEQGVKLSALCSSLLKNAQQKVEILIESADGVNKQDFTANE